MIRLARTGRLFVRQLIDFSDQKEMIPKETKEQLRKRLTPLQWEVTQNAAT